MVEPEPLGDLSAWQQLAWAEYALGTERLRGVVSDLEAQMTQWLHDAGYPDLHVEFDWTDLP